MELLRGFEFLDSYFMYWSYECYNPYFLDRTVCIKILVFGWVINCKFSVFSILLCNKILFFGVSYHTGESYD